LYLPHLSCEMGSFFIAPSFSLVLFTDHSMVQATALGSAPEGMAVTWGKRMNFPFYCAGSIWQGSCTRSRSELGTWWCSW
jgi:hypothetical protein